MKVLVVDDERDVEILYQQQFRKEIRSGELELLFTFSAQEALDMMAHLNPMDVVLLLSDINMPNMTGLELLKTVKEKYSYLQVFMVSAYGDEGNRSKAKTLGASDFFTKPVDFVTLRNRILNVNAL